ncbi:MAG: hypothetical protein JJU11_10320 [Candidatus Sumerlaeia bacterium]|nr:hypothetical protein [Candidatus Sumerlaeia bacterium]
MLYFWLLTLGSLLIVGAVMLIISRLAREVPDEMDKSENPTRLNSDQLRLIAYAIMVAICLVGALIEFAILSS